jgi:hypothetical protein
VVVLHTRHYPTMFTSFSRSSSLLRVVGSFKPASIQTLRKAVVAHAFSSVRPKEAANATVIKNESIRFPTMRVVYPEEDGKKGWKIMSRKEALDLASLKKMDLLIGKSLVIVWNPRKSSKSYVL